MTDRTPPVWAAIARKRAIRAFTSEPLAPGHLDRILRAGRHAPSSKNRQRWTFVVCRNRKHLQELSTLGPFAGHVAGAAVAVALVTPVPPPEDNGRSILFDLGLAAENMMLAAWELGIGSVPATVYEHDLARQLLGLPDDQSCEYLLSFGYPADPDDLVRPAKVGGRLPLDTMVREERW